MSKKIKQDFFQSTFSRELGLEKQTTLEKYILLDKFIEKIKPTFEKTLSKYLTKTGIDEVIEAIREAVSRNMK